MWRALLLCWGSSQPTTSGRPTNHPHKATATTMTSGISNLQPRRLTAPPSLVIMSHWIMSRFCGCRCYPVAVDPQAGGDRPTSLNVLSRGNGTIAN